MNEYPYFNPYAPYMPMQNGAYTSANQIQGVKCYECPYCQHHCGKDCVMEIFKTLLDQVDDEICGAKEYAELALSLKDESPQLSNMYNDLSKQEYSHIQILHSHLLKVYESFGEQTDMVQNLFDWQNKKIIDGAAHVKTLIDMYK